MRLPEIVAHADWSANPPGRQIAVARRRADGRYTAAAPRPVGDLAGLVPGLIAAAGPGGTALLGVDFPIGVPLAYARQVGIRDFRKALPAFGAGAWRDFYAPAAAAAEISLYRPFYPARPGARGSVSRAHLCAALGVEAWPELHRRCDRDYPGRAAAAALFWTLGGNQVGKAALNGWREIVVPALRARRTASARGHPAAHLPFRLWPYDGALADLLAAPGLVLAETYPGEIYGHLGLAIADRRRSKRRQDDRAADAARLAATARRLGIGLARDLAATIRDGFGADGRGEDRFDAAVGLLGMVNILRGDRPPHDPTDRVCRRIEGWILGQAPR